MTVDQVIFEIYLTYIFITFAFSWTISHHIFTSSSQTTWSIFLSVKSKISTKTILLLSAWVWTPSLPNFLPITSTNFIINGDQMDLRRHRFFHLQSIPIWTNAKWEIIFAQKMPFVSTRKCFTGIWTNSLPLSIKKKCSWGLFGPKVWGFLAYGIVVIEFWFCQ